MSRPRPPPSRPASQPDNPPSALVTPPASAWSRSHVCPLEPATTTASAGSCAYACMRVCVCVCAEASAVPHVPHTPPRPAAASTTLHRNRLRRAGAMYRTQCMPCGPVRGTRGRPWVRRGARSRGRWLAWPEPEVRTGDLDVPAAGLCLQSYIGRAGRPCPTPARLHACLPASAPADPVPPPTPWAVGRGPP